MLMQVAILEEDKSALRFFSYYANRHFLQMNKKALLPSEACDILAHKIARKPSAKNMYLLQKEVKGS